MSCRVHAADVPINGQVHPNEGQIHDKKIRIQNLLRRNVIVEELKLKW
jgi:hypothetical protein